MQSSLFLKNIIIILFFNTHKQLKLFLECLLKIKILFSCLAAAHMVPLRVYKVDHHPNGHGSHICSSRIRNVSLKNSLNSVRSVSKRDFASKSSISLTTLQTWWILEPLQKGHLGNITHVNKRNTLEKASPKHPAPLIQANPP